MSDPITEIVISDYAESVKLTFADKSLTAEILSILSNKLKSLSPN